MLIIDGRSKADVLCGGGPLDVPVSSDDELAKVAASGAGGQTIRRPGINPQRAEATLSFQQRLGLLDGVEALSYVVVVKKARAQTE